jgi:phosphate butyryltransferase
VKRKGFARESFFYIESRLSAMPLADFDQLFAEADAARPGVPVAAAGGADVTVLEALRAACDRGWVKPIVTGCIADIQRLAEQGGVSLADFTLLETDAPASVAVAQVREGRARFLMKGQISTPALLKAILDPEKGLRTGRVICQVVHMVIKPARRSFLLADTGICIRPTLDQKKGILCSAVAVAHALGEGEPRVAAMAATESVTEAMPETVEAAELQHCQETGELTGCRVQGPLSFDLAYEAGAADKKRMEGAVRGAADVMLFADLLSANLTVKAIMYTADCAYGGVLCGAVCPVVFMSRADTTLTRLRSLALTMRVAAATMSLHRRYSQGNITERSQQA